MNFCQFAIDMDLPAVRPVKTDKHIHQSAFSCSVLTEQSEYFSPMQGQIDFVISQYPWEVFGNINHSHDDLIVGVFIVHVFFPLFETPGRKARIGKELGTGECPPL
jgi:hypothetical protein